MPYYTTCPDCGAHLDPGEACDCRKAPAYLSVSNVARRWGVSKDLVYDLLRHGDIPALRIGKAIRIPASAISDYEASHTSSATAAPRGKAKRQLVLRL